MPDDGELSDTDRKLARALRVALAYLLVGVLAARFVNATTDSWLPLPIYLGSVLVLAPAFALYVARLKGQPFWQTLLHPSRFRNDPPTTGQHLRKDH